MAVNPPLDGTLTIPSSLDFHFAHNAHLPMFVYNAANSQDITQITFLEFGRAAHRAASLLRAGKDREVVAFIALADTIVYQAVTVGLMVAGLVPFPISPRNTPAAVVHLLKSTACHRLITTPTTLQSLLDAVRAELPAEYDLVIDEIPTLHQLYPHLGTETPQDPFTPYPAPPAAPLSDVAIILHSSGSTGFPKAISQTHRIISHWAAFPCISEFRDHTPRPRIAGMMLPPFHTLGIYTHLLYTLFGMNPVAVYPPSPSPVIPTPENILEHVRRTRANAMITIPALLGVWAQSTEAVELLAGLLFVGYAGGAVPPKLGHLLVSSGIKLNPGYGGTEFGSPTYAFKRKGDEGDYEYMEFSDRARVRWVERGDGRCECVFLTTDTHSLPVENLQGERGYATKDLWERHPTKGYLWKIVGRVDDVIIHSSGEKTVPTPMEDVVMSSPYVNGAVIFGHAHSQPGILIELKDAYTIDTSSPTQVAEMRNMLWPTIEDANAVAPAFSRLFKEMVLFVDGRLPRTAKGTVGRKAALREYAGLIEGLYETVEQSARGEDVVPPRTWGGGDVRAWLGEQVGDVLSGTGRVGVGVVEVGRDLFEQGFDSLSATILRRRIVGALRATQKGKKAAEAITQNTVYTYPTIERLTTFLVQLVEDPDGAGTGTGADAKEEIEGMIERFSIGLDPIPIPIKTNTNTNTPRKVVLLTGSTGNLGSQILADLLGDVGVERVFAFNRRRPGGVRERERHVEMFVGRGLDVGLLSDRRLVYVQGDMGVSGWGVERGVYDEMRETVTIVIHTAWRLDFNLSRASFEGNVRGTRGLVDFAREGRGGRRVVFTSSVAAAQGWGAGAEVPEEVLGDAGVAVGSGYGEGKYVAERILAKSGIRATSVRIGQISGGRPRGAWATTDWVPILVKSGVAMGVLPRAVGLVSWVPMHVVSKVILDIAFEDGEGEEVVNVVHPRPVRWDVVVDAIKVALGREVEVRVVPFGEWFEMLERRAESAGEGDVRDVPAIKLLEFFRSIARADRAIVESGHQEDKVESGGLPRFATHKAQRLSRTMREVQPIGEEDVRRWVDYWRSVEFL